MKLSTNNFFAAIKSLVMGGGRNEVGVPFNDAGFLKRAELPLSAIFPDPTNAGLTDNSGGAASGTLAAETLPTAVTIGTMGGASDNALETVGATNSGDVSAAIMNNFHEFFTAQAANLAQLTLLKVAVASLAASVNLLNNNGSTIVASETHARAIITQENVDTIGNITYVIPRDYDEQTDELSLRVNAAVLGVTTDGDVQLDAEVYVKSGTTALSADKNPTKPTTVLTVAPQWLTFDLHGYGLLRDDVVTIKLITDGHNDTNGEEVVVLGHELVYASTLVSYDVTDGADNDTGNQLR